MLTNTCKLCLALLLSALLVACSSAPKRNIASAEKTVKEPILTTDADTPLALIKQAQLTYSSTGNLTQRNALLLKAADKYVEQAHCDKAQTILQVLQPELQLEAQQILADVITAECLLNQASPFSNTALHYIREIKLSKEISARGYLVKARAEEAAGNNLAAAQAYLKSGEESAVSGKVWALLQTLSDNTLRQASLQRSPMQPYLQLSLLVRQSGLQPLELQQAVFNWQQRNHAHPLAMQLPPEVVEAMQVMPLTAQKIAVLLPLSGRLSAQGNAIKHGVLGAYFGQSQSGAEPTQLQFFDTHLLETEQLALEIEPFDVIIGPLLKNEVEALLPFIGPEKTFLALNRLDNANPETINSNHFFFALAPEDEASQLAEKVYQSGAMHPIIVADNSSGTMRMAEAFIQQWQAINRDNRSKPQLTVFDTSKDMRTGVTSALDVNQSNQRIQQIERLLNQQLYSVPRNRRDVDAFIIFATPEQTELLNPMIEASLSPFNDKSVPVFASHRSFSMNLSNNSLRDLRNLTFSDMPWMLPQHSWQELAAEVEALWPQNNDTLRRLFALGYDSFNLLKNLRQLKTLPQISSDGLTGQLQITDNGIITRRLPYGFVSLDKVTLLAMD